LNGKAHLSLKLVSNSSLALKNRGKITENDVFGSPFYNVTDKPMSSGKEILRKENKIS